MEKKGKIALVSALVVAGLLLVGVVAAGPKAAKQCNDGNDNDGDGYTDYPLDPGCYSRQDNSELNPAVQCDDGTDNDGDTKKDMQDAGCSSPSDNDETNCGDGVCEGGETQANCPADCGQPDSCSDTDGGNVITVFGTTSGFNNNNFYNHSDFCVDAAQINEYFCTGSQESSQQQSCGTDGYGAPYCIGSDVYKDFTDYFCGSGKCDSTTTPQFQQTCQYGCTNGQCNAAPGSCSDTDGGFNPMLQGTASGTYNGQPYSYTDLCNTSTYLTEFYCSGSSPKSAGIDCAVGNTTQCIGGACA